MMKNYKKWTIPEGKVKSVKDSQGRIIWSGAPLPPPDKLQGKWVLKYKIPKITEAKEAHFLFTCNNINYKSMLFFRDFILTEENLTFNPSTSGGESVEAFKKGIITEPKYLLIDITSKFDELSEGSKWIYDWLLENAVKIDDDKNLISYGDGFIFKEPEEIFIPFATQNRVEMPLNIQEGSDISAFYIEIMDDSSKTTHVYNCPEYDIYPYEYPALEGDNEGGYYSDFVVPDNPILVFEDFKWIDLYTKYRHENEEDVTIMISFFITNAIKVDA